MAKRNSERTGLCLREPGVRLSALEMVFTRVLSLECCLSSFTSARVHSRRTTRFFLAMVLVMISSPALLASSDSTTFWRARTTTAKKGDLLSRRRPQVTGNVGTGASPAERKPASLTKVGWKGKGQLGADDCATNGLFVLSLLGQRNQRRGERR